jgi:hypothetical protein
MEYEMKARRSLFFVSLVVSPVLTMLFTACASPPEAERHAALTAMNASHTAGADKYVPADFDAARKLLDTAEAQLALKKYREAKQGYIDARIAFEKAADNVDAVRKAMTSQAAAAVAALEKRWKALQVIAHKAQGKTALWEVDSKSFLEELKTAREMVAVDPAGAMAKADKLKGFCDTYGEYFSKLAANPGKHRDVERKTKGRAGRMD